MLEPEKLLELKSSWERLKETDKPIYIYGMGDGCLKLMKQFERFKIAPKGIFASDEFVRGQSFMGFPVLKLSDVEAKNPDGFVIALAFAAGYSELIEKIDALSKKHDLILPDTAVIGGEPFLKETLTENLDDINSVYGMLSDDLSREVFKSVLSYKITGDISYLKECETPPEEAYTNILKPHPSDAYADLGAYNGDTIKEYLYFSNSARKIYAVEPDAKNFKKLKAYLDELPFAEAINAAAWDSDGEITFSKEGGKMARQSKNGVSVKTVRLDKLLCGESVDYIKYDVEGEEARALSGSRETIEKHAPSLCVAVYHRLKDMWEIPLMIKKMYPDYEFYLRHYPYYPAWETNLIAVRETAERAAIRGKING